MVSTAQSTDLLRARGFRPAHLELRLRLRLGLDLRLLLRNSLGMGLLRGELLCLRGGRTVW